MKRYNFTPRGGDSNVTYPSESSVRFTPSGWATPVLVFEQEHDAALALRLDVDEGTPQQSALLARRAPELYARFGVLRAGNLADDLAFLLATNGRGVLWSHGNPK